jgi:glycine/D-amino acid oxidase-like deaminating enzyme
VDIVPGLANAWMSSGQFRHGILMAPVTGRALASWIARGQQPSEVVGLEASRFG